MSLRTWRLSVGTPAVATSFAVILLFAPLFVSAETVSVSFSLQEPSHVATIERGPVSTWTQLREAVSGVLTRNTLEASISAHNTVTGYQALKRGFLSFDTSSIPTGATIESASLVLTPRSVFNDYPSPVSYVQVYAGGGFSLNPEHKAQDYATCGALDAPTPLGNTGLLSELSAGVPFTFTLNDDGLSQVRKAGVTKLCLREGHDAENQPVSEPVAVPWKQSGASFYTSDALFSSFAPRLDVVYSFTPAVIPPVPTGGNITTVEIPATLGTDVWVSNGNGVVLNTWQNIRSALLGYQVSSTPVLRTAVNILDSIRTNFNVYLGFDRAFVSFDLSSIPDDAEILDVRLSTTVSEVYDDYLSPNASINLYPSFQYAPLATTSAYARCGDALTNPTPLAPPLHVRDLEVGTREEFFFSDVGVVANRLSEDWTSFCFRTGFDANDAFIGDFTPSWRSAGAGFASSFSPTPELRPTLQVTYRIEPQYEECCSSVAFIPGFEGSGLYHGSNEVWPPTLFDVQNDLNLLALDGVGEPVYNNIRVGGVLASVYGVSIYDGFIDFLNSIDRTQGDGTIKEWRALQYDWRLPVSDTVEYGVETVVGHVDLVSAIEALAAESDTGKVTLIGHSNGGLLGKALIRKLEQENKAHLIDTFVLVGSPQLGTPQAIGGLLHGEKSELGVFPFFLVNKAQARALAARMESAYTLLPSREYLARVTDPTIIFDDSAGYTESWRNVWGSAVGNFSELFEFLTDAFDTRTDPTFNDIQRPSTLDTDILSRADAFHSTYDHYAIPDSIRVVQIAGWGLPTIKRIEYTDYPAYDFPYYVPVYTSEGDGTVVYPSAISSVGETYYFNLDSFNEFEESSFEHKDILNPTPILNLIHNIVRNETFLHIDFTSIIKPEVGNIEEKLKVAVYSPITLGAYDSRGRFTGVDPSFDQSSGLGFIKEEIPNSFYTSYGEGKYLIVPNNESYNFVFESTGVGTATIEVSSIEDDVSAPIAVFSDIAIESTTNAALNIESGNAEPLLLVDINGDGDTDEVVVPDGTSISIDEIIQLIREKITTLDANQKLKNKLLKKLEKLEKKVTKLKYKNADKRAMRLAKLVGHKMSKGRVNESDAQEIIYLLEELEKVL